MWIEQAEGGGEGSANGAYPGHHANQGQGRKRAGISVPSLGTSWWVVPSFCRKCTTVSLPCIVHTSRSLHQPACAHPHADGARRRGGIHGQRVKDGGVHCIVCSCMIEHECPPPKRCVLFIVGMVRALPSLPSLVALMGGTHRLPPQQCTPKQPQRAAQARSYTCRLDALRKGGKS
jgi:hypothetical protein